MITKEQLRYVVKVYPERVTQKEAKEAFDRANLDGVDVSYWHSAAKIVNELALSNTNHQEVTK